MEDKIETEDLIPTEDEVKTWLVSTLQHACHIEYFLDRLNLGREDFERPHDLVGLGNKYDWNVIKGCSLEYRDPKPDFQTYIMPALTLHRKQHHHQKWNKPDPKDKTKPISEASEDNMLLGAVDTVCSLLENRRYQGGAHSYDSIEISEKILPHKIPYILKIIPKMKALKQPSLEQITSLNGFPNIGLKEEVYYSIAKRTNETVEMLRKEHGYSLR